jgi:hypothetical protein
LHELQRLSQYSINYETYCSRLADFLTHRTRTSIAGISFPLHKADRACNTHAFCICNTHAFCIRRLMFCVCSLRLHISRLRPSTRALTVRQHMSLRNQCRLFLHHTRQQVRSGPIEFHLRNFLCMHVLLQFAVCVLVICHCLRYQALIFVRVCVCVSTRVDKQPECVGVKGGRKPKGKPARLHYWSHT